MQWDWCGGQQENINENEAMSMGDNTMSLKWMQKNRSCEWNCMVGWVDSGVGGRRQAITTF